MASDVLAKLRDYLAAHPVGRDVVDRTFHLCPPCDRRAVEDAERELGFRLPGLLTDIYTTVANGGFGPGYGVMGVSGGFTDDSDHSIVDAYKVYAVADPNEPNWAWPRAWVPFCHWGCIVYSVLDCSHAPHPVYFVAIGDKEPDQAMDSIIHAHKRSLSQWLTDWMKDKDLWAEVFG
jgi:hypothetical protein